MQPRKGNSNNIQTILALIFEKFTRKIIVLVKIQNKYSLIHLIFKSRKHINH
jgi:hypothetical protein